MKLFPKKINLNTKALFLISGLTLAAILLLTGLLNSDLFLTRNTSAAPESDAIAVRILENPDHYHPERWYQEQGYKGDPEELTVDGYKAVRSGRTTYVTIGDTDSGGNEINTYIFLISHDQNAGQETKEIYERMLDNLSFNSNLDQQGECRISSLVCQEDEDCPQDHTCQSDNKCLPDDIPGCRTDEDCPEGVYCDSEKARVTRDTIRMGDIKEIKMLLKDYKQKNEDDKYPVLEAGTYLPGKSVSIWPSWKNEFTSILKESLPEDPVNTLGACEIDCCPDSCADDSICDYDFDPRTCWDDIHKWFADPSPNNTQFNLPNNSYAYSYETVFSGYNYDLCASTEYINNDTTEEVCLSEEETVRIQQPGGVDETLQVTFSTAQTPEDFYNYQSASFNNDTFYDILEVDKSEIFLHYSKSTNHVSLGMIHDFPNNSFGGYDKNGDQDPDGGSVHFEFLNTPDKNRLAVKDDPGDTSWDLGHTIQDGDIWTWGWAECCTDGGMIEMQQDSWSFTIDPVHWDGLDTWRVAYINDFGNFDFIELDMSKPLTVSYEKGE